MSVEWQGDHRMLGDDVKQDFERMLTKLGFEPEKFLVEVRRAPDGKGAYEIFISDLARPDRDTWKLDGGRAENWIEQFGKIAHRR